MPGSPGSSRPAHALRFLVLLLTVLAVGACDLGSGPGATAEVTVMTRNVYLGADIFRLTQAQTAEDIPVIAAEIWGIMQ